MQKSILQSGDLLTSVTPWAHRDMVRAAWTPLWAVGRRVGLVIGVPGCLTCLVAGDWLGGLKRSHLGPVPPPDRPRHRVRFPSTPGTVRLHD